MREETEGEEAHDVGRKKAGQEKARRERERESAVYTNEVKASERVRMRRRES